MSDELISRQAAIDALDAEYTRAMDFTDSDAPRSQRTEALHRAMALQWSLIVLSSLPAAELSALRAAQPLTRAGLLEIKERLYEIQRGAFYDDGQIDAFIDALLDSLADGETK